MNLDLLCLKGQTEFFSLGKVTSLEGNSNFKTATFHLKTDLVLHPVHDGGVG